MLLDERTVSVLEFDKIIGMLAERARTEGARKACLELRPESDPVAVTRALGQTDAAVALLREKGRPPFGRITDVSGLCERADKGAVLTPRELLDVAELLRACRGLIEYSKTNRTFETVIDEIFSRLVPDRQFEDRIWRAIPSEDTLADDASPALADVRRKLRRETLRVREILNRYTGGEYSKYLQENIVTIRNGRYVIPVRAECRNEIKGLVHDTSSSGATYFIEPIAVVEANNAIRALEAEEKREIERILSEFSSEVAARRQILEYDNQNADELAVLFAKAELSELFDCVSPKIETKKRIIVYNGARHPLIPKENVVPVDVRLGGEFDTLVITGPNTGGKTVTLKTLGLFSLMVQSGLRIPVKEGSAVCVFDSVLVDLGDAQSIERSLSTFSSHMVNIVDIIDKLTADSLVLFDELGAGTDPIEGAALAIAIIEEVRGSGALCAATTHYAELKSFAIGTPGVSNASCEFDVETLRPTYRLSIGAPGRSCALAISERLGLPARVIERAKSEVGSEDRRFEEVIDRLEDARMDEERRIGELSRERAEFEEYRRRTEEEIARKYSIAEKTLEDASKKAVTMVEGARISSEYVFSQLDRAKKAKDTERAAEELEAARRAVREHLRANEDVYDPVETEKDDGYVLPRPLKKGDRVWVSNIRREGVVLRDPDASGKITVLVGNVRTKTTVSNLRLASDVVTVTGEDEKKKTAREYTATAVSRSCSPEIDLRGMTGDEAWTEIDRYLDQVVLCGLQSVRIIHGKGTGALRQSVWSHLKGDRRVASFRIGQFGEGDTGVTVVEMKK